MRAPSQSSGLAAETKESPASPDGTEAAKARLVWFKPELNRITASIGVGCANTNQSRGDSNEKVDEKKNTTLASPLPERAYAESEQVSGAASGPHRRAGRANGIPGAG